MTILLTVLVVSLLGSLHCVGMCGPLVAIAVGDSSVTGSRGRLLLNASYHGGRLITYCLVGLACGWLGARLNWSGSLVGIQRLAALMMGAMMIGAGVVGLLRYSGLRLPHLAAGNWIQLGIQKWVARGQRAAFSLRPLPRSLTIGLLTAFLPCGWLYMFALAAAGTGSTAWGAAVMVTFWLGTVPVLALLGISVQTLAATVGRKVPLAISVLIVLLGIYTIGGRATISASAFDRTGAWNDQTGALDRVHEAARTPPPCCSQEPE